MTNEEWLKDQCNRLTYGVCRNAACVRRAGGNDKDGTCHAFEIHQRLFGDQQIYDAEYQKFVESMLPHCKCEIDQPCDGVLAGGPCDRQKEHRDTMDSGINVENL